MFISPIAKVPMVGLLHFLKLVPEMFLTLAIVSSQTSMYEYIILKAVLRSLNRPFLPGAATKDFLFSSVVNPDPELFSISGSRIIYFGSVFRQK